MVNYSRNLRFNPQSEQASESVLVSRNADETEKRLGGAGELPITLDLSKENTLSAEMLSLYESLLPTKESHEKRETFAKKIEKILNEEWPGKDIKVHMFGSSMNDLGTTQSDVDLCVTTQWDGLKDIYLLSNCLRNRDMIIEQIVSKAKVPIVRLSDPYLNLACDINVNNTLALHNTRLIRKYVNIDPRVRPLAMMVKYWARRRVLNDAAKGGTISTYTWTCIILNFLQMRDPPILPVLHELPHEDVEPIMVNGEDASFYENVESLAEFGKPNKESVGGLLFAFFRRMAFEFDYDKHVISLRQGKYLTKAEKGWDICKGWKMLCVEEPFNTTRNLGNSADDVSVNGLKEEFKRAYDILFESASLITLCEEYRFQQQYNHYHHHYHYHYYYQNQTRYYNKHLSKQRSFNKTGGTWKSSNRKPVCTTKFHQNGQQNNCLNVTTDNFHDMDGKNSYSQNNEENESNVLRFNDNYSSRQNSNYSTINSSEEFVASSVSEPIKRTGGYYENTDISSCSTRKQFDNIQNRRERNGLSSATRHAEVDNFQHNILKEEPYSPQISHVKNNNSSNNNHFNRHHIKKRSDDQFNNNYNYNRTSQSQDTDSLTYKPNQEEFARHAGTTSNQNQSFYKNGVQKASASRFQHSSDQKLSYSYDSGIRYNNSDQKPFYDSDKRNYHKNHKQYYNKQDLNLRQVEDSNSNSMVPSVVDYSPSHSSFDHSNPVQIPNPKSGHKSNNNNNNTKYRNFNKQRQKPENVDLTNNNYSYNKASDNSISSFPISPSNNNGFASTYPNHGNGYLPSQAFTSSQQQNHHGQPNGGSSNYQRRMSHQSSSDGSNSQTSGNTSNTSYSNSSSNSQTSGNTSNTSYSNSSYTKSNYQKNNIINQNNYQQQSQNKSNNNGNKKRKYNNGFNNNYSNNYNNSGNGNSRSNSTISNSSTVVSNGNNYDNSGNGGSRSNSTTSNSSTIAPNDTDSVLNYHEETIIHNTSSQMNQGHYYGGTNGYKAYGSNNGYNKGYDNSNSNSWKNSSGHNATSPKTLNGNNSNANANGPKSANGCNNFSNRSVNGSNSNNHPRCNANYNSNNYSKNQNNNNNANKSVDNNNSSMQTKNVNNNYSNSRNNSNGSTNCQRNNQTKKGINRNHGHGKNNRKNSNAVKTEKKEDGVNHQQQYLQETSFQERQNHQNTQLHQQKKFFQNGQNNNNSKGKGGQRNSYFNQTKC